MNSSSQSKLLFKKNLSFLLSRLVELDRLILGTMEAERTELADAGGADPDIVILRPSQSKGGVTQEIVKVAGAGSVSGFI